MKRDPEIEKFYKDGVVFAEIVVNADPCDRRFCPFLREKVRTDYGKEERNQG